MANKTTTAQGRTGRPSAYTSDKASEICDRIAKGESLHSICNDDHMPHRATVLRWLADGREDFRDHYAQARDAAADLLGETVREIAEEAVREAQTAEDSKTANALVQARRLQIDALKWTAGQMAPKKWGTKHSTNEQVKRADHEGELNKARDRVKAAATVRELRPITQGADDAAGDDTGRNMEP